MSSDTPFAAALWRGHLLFFDRPELPTYSARQGAKLLLIAVLLEVVRLGARNLGIAVSRWWTPIQLAALLLATFGLVRGWARVKPAALGLRPWSEWSLTEKLYLLQVLPLAAGVFSLIYAARVRALWAQPRAGWVALTIFLPQFAWGFYQELLYRGLLQTELVRRLGAASGILLANLLFTFGPLHAYHFVGAADNPRHLWIFAAIFAIGLLFAVLFRRSGNLWIVGAMHGIGCFFIDGLRQVV